MGKRKYIPLYIRVNEPSYRSLRKLSYLSERSMADLVNEMIEERIEKEKKVLTNADIAI